MSAGATASLSFAQTVSARCQRVISRRRFFKEAKAKTTEEEEREEDLEAKHEHLTNQKPIFSIITSSCGRKTQTIVV